MILMVFTNFLIILTSNIFDITNPTIDFTFLALFAVFGIFDVFDIFKHDEWGIDFWVCSVFSF